MFGREGYPGKSNKDYWELLRAQLRICDYKFNVVLISKLFLPILPCRVYAAAAKSRQSCPTLCDPIDGSPPGSSVPGILQARTLEWVAISFSNAWKWKVKVKSLGCVWLLATPWTVACAVPPSMGFSRQEYWSGLSLPSPMVQRKKWRLSST